MTGSIEVAKKRNKRAGEVELRRSDAGVASCQRYRYMNAKSIAELIAEAKVGLCRRD